MVYIGLATSSGESQRSVWRLKFWVPHQRDGVATTIRRDLCAIFTSDASSRRLQGCMRQANMTTSTFIAGAMVRTGVGLDGRVALRDVRNKVERCDKCVYL